jgi:hypothetical protein
MHMTACSFYAFSDWEGIGGTSNSLKNCIPIWIPECSN